MRNLFKKERKSIYILGDYINLHDEADFRNILAMQAIDQETAYGVSDALELVFNDNQFLFHQNDRLVGILDINDGKVSFEPPGIIRQKLHYLDVEPHKFYQIDLVEHSDSYLGGGPEDGFAIPEFDFCLPFQYLGKISRSAEPFSWLPFDLNLTAPIYFDFSHAFMDYSDPLKPVVIDPESLAEGGSEFISLEADSVISFEKKYIRIREFDYRYSDIGHAGVPVWVQYPEIPICPVTGKAMKFVLAIDTFQEIKTEKSNIVYLDDMDKRYLSNMNFAGDGTIYFFFEPDSKILSFQIKNS